MLKMLPIIVVLIACGDDAPSDQTTAGTDGGRPAAAEDDFGNSSSAMAPDGTEAMVDPDAPLDLSLVGDWAHCGPREDCPPTLFYEGIRFMDDGTFAKLQAIDKPDDPLCVEVIAHPTSNRYSFDGVSLDVDTWEHYEVTLNGDTFTRHSFMDDGYDTYMHRITAVEEPDCP